MPDNILDQIYCLHVTDELSGETSLLKIDSNSQKSRAIFFRRCMLKRFAKQATKANEVSFKTKRPSESFTILLKTSN